jgi:hypothetical protein
MHTPALVRVAGCLFCFVACATTSISQSLTEPAQPAGAANTTHILYTGKLLGYFRIPDWQPGNSSPYPRVCPDLPKSPQTPEAGLLNPDTEAFLSQRNDPGAILVGTGDNFGPELQARVFNPPPLDSRRKPGQYTPGNKELYAWDEASGHWLSPEEVKDNPALADKLARGDGTIPMDNVGCFLVAARYAAVVPGKHDFYFGPERLRQLARFLAGIDPKDYPQQQYHPVQMLGANLVIKTSWMKDHKPLPDSELPPPFVPAMPKGLVVANLKDGNTVYPWFQGPRVTIKGLAGKEGASLLDILRNHGRFRTVAELLHSLDMNDPKMIEMAKNDPKLIGIVKEVRDTLSSSEALKLYRCEAGDGDPNNLPKDPSRECTELVDKVPRLEGTQLELEFRFPEPQKHQAGQQLFSLSMGKNYGLCHIPAGATAPPTREQTYCLRFSVYAPFFLYHPDGKVGTAEDYVSPGLFSLVPANSQRQYDVAIFGVVDTNLGEYVGTLNFAWLNDDDHYKTVVQVEDPAEALHQQLDYFEHTYELEHDQPFPGVKILLAQMSPQRARALAARVPEFHIVVTAADQEQSTGDPGVTMSWPQEKQKPHTVSWPQEKQKPHTVFAVPPPFWDKDKGQGFVRLGSIDLRLKADNTWQLVSRLLPENPKPRSPLPENPATEFWLRVASVLPRCLPANFVPAADDIPKKWDMLEWLTLCAMQQKTGADVAMIQKRDLFPDLPNAAGDAPGSVQQILDRIIWKGDFLTLLYVPGAAIQKTMEQSKKYEAEDSSSLSLADEKLRDLRALGIRYDAGRKEYLINEVPLDPGRLYAVATSDYVGVGDTGYPDLTAAAIDPATQPVQFPDKLNTISSLVCRMLYPADASSLCLGEIRRDSYFDEFIGAPVDARKGDTSAHQLWAWSILDHPDPVPGSKQARLDLKRKTSDAVNRVVEQRPIWDLSLQKLSLSVATLTHNFSDAEIDDKFGGITTTSVTSHRNHTLNSQLQMKLSRSSHKYDFFVSPAVNYNVQYLGISNAQRQVSQIANLSTLDTGLIWRIPSRVFPHLDRIVSVHFETPTISPITTFFLGTQTTVDSQNNIKIQDRLQFDQERSWTLLPRLGLRWQNRVSSIEVGGEGGKEFNAVAGYEFKTQQVVTDTCLPEAKETFAKCVKAKSTPPGATITKDSTVSVLRQGRFHAGAYWKVNLNVPLHQKLSYVLTDEGDFFLANFSTDNATDTRFRDNSKHQLKFSVWPSLSFGPAFQLLLYENKVNQDFLRQKQFMMQMDFGFDLFNSRQPMKQLKYKPSAKSLQ